MEGVAGTLAALEVGEGAREAGRRAARAHSAWFAVRLWDAGSARARLAGAERSRLLAKPCVKPTTTAEPVIETQPRTRGCARAARCRVGQWRRR